jgi:uncharacterized sulfatase
MKTTRKIILIMTDTQRTDMLGCYGNKGMLTPNLDRLASQGMLFRRAYTTQPVCGPARSGLFTGLYPHSNGSWANGMALGDNVKTVGQRLRDLGWLTAYIGKWHLDGGDYFGLGRCPDGWDSDSWYDMRCYLEEHGELDREWSRTADIMRKRTVTEDFTFGHRCSDRAIDFLRNHSENDFLLVVSYDEPHHPYVCPEPYASMYKDYVHPLRRNVMDALEDKPEHQRIWANQNARPDGEGHGIRHPDYFGCNSFVDHEIGRVLDEIDANAPDALVIYTSDHGDALGSHGLSNKGPAMYDEITRIPLIVRWPHVIQPDSSCDHPVSHIDIVPTIMESIGLPVPRLLEGKSLRPAFEDPRTRTNEAIFMEFGRYETDHDSAGGFQPVRAVFDGRLKLTVNLLTSDELYDLDTDPEELVNLIDSADHQIMRDLLHDELLDWMNRTRDPFRGYYWERRPWRTDARPATWVYTGFTRQRENEEYEPRQLDYSTGLEMVEATRKKD